MKPNRDIYEFAMIRLAESDTGHCPVHNVPFVQFEFLPTGQAETYLKIRSAVILSGRRFVRTVLDNLSGPPSTFCQEDLLSGPPYTFCQEDVLSGRRFVRTALDILCNEHK